MGRVCVVTDSTSDLPLALAEEWGITVVPCYVNFGTESYLDQVELTRSEFYHRLVSGPVHPTTAAPPSGLFAEAYKALLDKASGIISIHPPDRLSALRQSALNGWQLLKSSIPYRALDGGQLSIGLGWLAERAAKAAVDGADMDSVADLVGNLCKRVTIFAALESVEYLRRSGRVGWAQGTIGKLLRVRPLLRVHQGALDSLGYVRTQGNAMGKLVACVQGLGKLDSLAVLHSDAPELAARFIRFLADHSLPEPAHIINITPVLGCHVGPRGLGLAAIQR